MSTWPSTLPAPSLSFAGKVKPNATRVRMESGRYRQQRKATAEERQFTATWRLSEAEYATFLSWYTTDLENGTAAFDIDLPTGGEGLLPVSATIVGGKANRANTSVLYWDVTLQLEVQEANVWSEGVYDVLLELGDPSSLESAVSALHVLVNNTLPTHFY